MSFLLCTLLVSNTRNAEPSDAHEVEMEQVVAEIAATERQTGCKET